MLFFGYSVLETMRLLSRIVQEFSAHSLSKWGYWDQKKYSFVPAEEQL